MIMHMINIFQYSSPRNYIAIQFIYGMTPCSVMLVKPKPSRYLGQVKNRKIMVPPNFNHKKPLKNILDDLNLKVQGKRNNKRGSFEGGFC
jgi:hypothetical protein